MVLLPQIIDIRIVPALSPTGGGLLIGVESKNGRFYWGYCAQPVDTQSTPAQIARMLKDQSPAAFSDLVSQLDNYREEFPVTHIVTHVVHPDEPRSSAGGGTFSRRKLITGFLADDEPQVEQVQMMEKRPFPAPLRFGISQALLHAAAAESNQSLLSLLIDLYELTQTDTPIPLHVEANEGNIAVVSSILSTQVASLGYSTGSTNHKVTLGNNTERLQAHVRRVKAWIQSAAPKATPAIVLNIQGGFTELYENNEGKMLGALYGLEQAAKPYPLVMENLITGEKTAVSRTLRKLQSYMGVRQMAVRLAVSNDLFSTDALYHFVERKAVHQLYLDIERFGSIPQIVRFIQQCHEQNREVIVTGGEGAVKTAVAIALATRADALSGPPHLLYNEMIKQQQSNFR